MRLEQRSEQAPARRDWVSTTLMPSICSGMAGGSLFGCCCGWLLAMPHHFGESILGGAVIGTVVGLVITWVGAALTGIFRYLLKL